MSTERAQNLLRRYQEIYDREGRPGWAAPHSPTIPFVGHSWIPGEGVLIYASAENLAGEYSSTPGTVLQTNPLDRHRADFEAWKKMSPRSHFPSVHIQPVSDGPLQVAAAFVRCRGGLECPSDPVLAVELGAFANFAKFAIKSDTANQDYASDPEKLGASLPYVEADLDTLEPRQILMPRTTLAALKRRLKRPGVIAGSWSSLVSRLIERAVPATQANQRALNHLAKKPAVDERANKLKSQFETTVAPWLAWLPRVRGVNEESMWRLLGEIDLAKPVPET